MDTVQEQLQGIQTTLARNTEVLEGVRAKVEPMHEDWSFRQKLKASRKERRERWTKQSLIISTPFVIGGAIIGAIGVAVGWFK